MCSVGCSEPVPEFHRYRLQLSAGRQWGNVRSTQRVFCLSALVAVDKGPTRTRHGLLLTLLAGVRTSARLFVPRSLSLRRSFEVEVFDRIPAHSALRRTVPPYDCRTLVSQDLTSRLVYACVCDLSPATLAAAGYLMRTSTRVT